MSSLLRELNVKNIYPFWKFLVFFQLLKPYHWNTLLLLLYAIRNRRSFLNTERLKGRFKEEIFSYKQKDIIQTPRDYSIFIWKIKQNVVVKYHWIKYNHTYPLSKFTFSLTFSFFITYLGSNLSYSSTKIKKIVNTFQFRRILYIDRLKKLGRKNIRWVFAENDRKLSSSKTRLNLVNVEKRILLHFLQSYE